ncbi:HEAT repeat protein-like protein [Rhizodiscina lignyota]|uniref:HEAT repeat protein-like protein n=1 Tax=Rhizodiscina lignyota TaxID=1504668 RepID=A0A9P4M8R1_9PEZI|nr:HEAT repeat protein-like protein [Rhizodiscina lignyota]
MASTETASVTNGTAENPELDITKLHALPSEQQDLYLLNFAADLSRHVRDLDGDGASAQQVYVKREVFKIINLSSPAPTRVIRKNIGEALAGIFQKGDRKLLFESINELVGILNTGKEGKDLKTKHAAVYCLGAVFEAAGDSAISLSTLACVSCIKQIKPASSHAGFRSSIYKTLGRIFKGIQPSADEQTARDVWKQARTAASSDRAHLVQANACWCLEHLIRCTNFFDNSNDFEKLQSTIWKAIDSSSPPLRHAAATAFAAALVKNHSETPVNDSVPRIRKPKKTNKKPTDGDDEPIERSESPAPTKPAIQLSLSVPDILKHLSGQYVRPATSNRARAGIAVCYMKVFKGLSERIIETKYGEIARHLLNDVLSSPSITWNRYRLLITRKFVRTILEEVVGRQILSESAQLDAGKFLLNEVIKDYPQALKERPEPTKQALIGALSALSSLIRTLGLAVSSIAESVREGLLQVLQHPSYTVQIHAAACFRAFVVASPQNLLPSITICMNSVNRELNLLTGARSSPRRCVGFANGLSAMLSTSPYQPLYGSVDVNSRILSQATSLLKGAANSELKVSSAQIQVAWIMLGGLMTLGPNFVKIHLSQLLLLWKNALPKPLTKDHMVQRSVLELSYLAHVRECALGCMLTFLQFNSRLLTVDVTKRLAAMLQNTTVFLGSLPSRKSTEDPSQRLSSALDLYDYDLMVRRRVLQCYAKLISDGQTGSSEVLQQSNLLPFALASFADPENYAPSSLSTSIASAAGSFESIWDVGDNYGFGVSGMIRGFEATPMAHYLSSRHQRHWLTKRDADADVDHQLLRPICHAAEHDSILLYSVPPHEDGQSDPPITQVVNAAIRLFAILLPVQAPKVQEGMLEQISTFFSASSLQRDPPRKAAMTVNVAIAMLATLQVANKETAFQSGDLKSGPVEKAIQELLHVFAMDQDQYVRNVAAEALGRLCSSAGNAFTTAEVNTIVEQIVSNREPAARSGCAVALGCIHTQLGGMAAGYHLKNILGILMSLASDPHPEVHFWALESLSRVAESAGLTFSGYVTSTLGMLAQLYSSDTHNEEAASAASSNSEMLLLSPAAITRCIDSIINVLGPDLQDMSKARDLVMKLVAQFQDESEELVQMESLRCLEHLSLYAPGFMEYAAYVKGLQKNLDSDSLEMRSMAIDGLHNLMRRDADDVIRTADKGLEDQLWLAFNDLRDQDVIQSIFRNWLHQTGLVETGQWIQRCNHVLTKITARPGQQPPPKTAPPKSTGVPDLQDEEAAGFAASSGNAGDESAVSGTSSQQLLRWQVRTFAMDLLQELLSMVAKDVAAKDESTAEQALQAKIGDVVRIAFSASTAGVVSLRVRGLQIVDQVLKLFGKTPDPDFAEASLLEQYQAQIGSALTPAFAADSSPELAAQAVNVCATFLATGIVTDVDRMGRILKLLVSALENFSTDADTASIGELKGLGSNAMVMVKMSVFSAWAELQIASAEQSYLVDVLAPHLEKLTPLWLTSLREYARLRFEPDASSNVAGSTLSGNLDSIYAALNRDTLLQFYQAGWLKFVDAIASLVDQDSDFVFDALDGRTEGDAEDRTNGKPTDINYRNEPAAFFFVLFGLAFEALAGRSEDSRHSRDQKLEILLALKKILRPAVSGNAIYRDVVFSETMDLLDRLVLTEPLNLQLVVVDIVKNLCLSHPSARKVKGAPVEEENLSEDIEQLFELTRIIVLVLAGLVPNLSESKTNAHTELNDEATHLLLSALSALVSTASVFPSIIRTDLHACLIHIFTVILGTPSAQPAAVPSALPIFRKFLTSLAREPQQDTPRQLRGALTKCLATLKRSQQRQVETSIQCEKNVLLASTILLSTAGSLFNGADPLLERLIDDMTECLDSPMPSKVAAGCCKSLLVLSRRGKTEEAIATMLLPKVIAFVTREADDEEVEGLEESRMICVSALVAFVQSLDKAQVAPSMALVIPTLLKRASLEGSTVHKEIAARLLELAAVDQTIFRAIVGGMEPEMKSFTEDVLKALSSEEKKEKQVEPTIALKMFGT